MQQYGVDAMANRLLTEGAQLFQAGRFAEAKALYDRVIALAPHRVEPHLNRGEIALAEEQYEEALASFQKASQMRPDLPPALEGAGDALLALGRPEQALTVFQTLQAKHPQLHSAFRGAGEAFKQLGHLDDARAALERAVALAPDVAGHHYGLAQIARFVANDPRLAGLERLAGKAAALSEPARCELHFALAKAYDDLGRHGEAFEHWQKANAIKRRHTAYDERLFLGILRELETAFTPAVIAARSGVGDPSAVPVFVVGMPRSGTTLVEQIIASHPKAFGDGEQMYLHQLLGQGLAGPQFPANFSRASNDALRQMGSLYAARLAEDAPGAARVVDKLPANFMLCGLIHLILPNAKIIHVRRDPLDTCFSCFTNLFSQNIDYSYDLGELGRYYRGYERLMAHWRRLLPEGAMLEVCYEDLLGDFEPQARRIIAYTGLEWDEACLAFHRTERVVHTLSAAQVRQPLYRTAIGRATPYAPWLTPLRQALGMS